MFLRSSAPFAININTEIAKERRETQKQFEIITGENMKRTTSLLVLLLLCCAPACAQDMSSGNHSANHHNAPPAAEATEEQEWAKQRLAKSSRHQEWVKVKNGTREVNSFVVYPEVKTKATAVVVIHEIFGMSDWVQLEADELAAAGYIAIAPDLLSGMGTKGGGTSDFADNNAIGKAIRDLPPDQITSDLNAATLNAFSAFISAVK